MGKTLKRSAGYLSGRCSPLQHENCRYSNWQRKKLPISWHFLPHCFRRKSHTHTRSVQSNRCSSSDSLRGKRRVLCAPRWAAYCTSKSFAENPCIFAAFSKVCIWMGRILCQTGQRRQTTNGRPLYHSCRDRKHFPAVRFDVRANTPNVRRTYR